LKKEKQTKKYRLTSTRGIGTTQHSVTTIIDLPQRVAPASRRFTGRASAQSRLDVEMCAWNYFSTLNTRRCRSRQCI